MLNVYLFWFSTEEVDRHLSYHGSCPLLWLWDVAAFKFFRIHLQCYVTLTSCAYARLRKTKWIFLVCYYLCLLWLNSYLSVMKIVGKMGVWKFVLQGWGINWFLSIFWYGNILPAGKSFRLWGFFSHVKLHIFFFWFGSICKTKIKYKQADRHLII